MLPGDLKEVSHVYHSPYAPQMSSHLFLSINRWTEVQSKTIPFSVHVRLLLSLSSHVLLYYNYTYSLPGSKQKQGTRAFQLEGIEKSYFPFCHFIDEETEAEEEFVLEHSPGNSKNKVLPVVC